MQCQKCNKDTNEIVWVKRFVEIVEFGPHAIDDYEENIKSGNDYLNTVSSFTLLREYGRREFLKLVTDDVEGEKNTGESFYCKDCFKELDK